MKNPKMITIALLAATLFLFSCSDDEEVIAETASTEPTVPFQELYDQGIDRYLGTINPISSTITSPGITEHVFSSDDGPICFTGNPYSMTTRDGSGDGLMIFLQGGGACTPISCEAIETGIPLFPLGILNPSDTQNPVLNYDLGYVPYCDGSLFTGDNEVDSNGDGQVDRFFKGIQNLSAALDVVAQTYPSPSHILLTGNSAGGFGVHPALPLVRKLYPDVSIDVINDSGVGISNPGAQEILIQYWNSSAFFPESCSTCIDEFDGNLTDYHAYQLSQDENIRMAYISSKQDSVVTVGLEGGGPAFEVQLLEAANELNSTFPDRFQSFIAGDESHTFLIRQFERQVGGIAVRQWISSMLSGSENWQSVSD